MSAVSAHPLLPARLLPVLYAGWAHACLAAAFALAALYPELVAGFFYDPRVIAAVHLVTLGWLGASILGAVYVVGPLALRMPMPARGMDYAAWGLVVIGTLGLVSHFWIGRYPGVGWSGTAVFLGIGHVAGRVWKGLRAAPIEPAVKLHVALAFANILASGLLGVLLGFDKEADFLPGNSLSNAFAHAHLAALGWVVMMVVGIGYRMLPMMLPSAMPRGPGLGASALLLEAGALGLFAGFLAGGASSAGDAAGLAGGVGSALLAVSALAALAAFGVFLAQVRFMLQNRRPAPSARPRPDFHVWHAGQAIAYLAAAGLFGLALVLFPISEHSLGPAAAYGVLGLVGFLAQMVVGVEATLLPMLASTHALAAGAAPETASPHRMAHRGALAAGFALWSLGVPLLAAGAGLASATLAGAGAWLLLAASLLGAFNAARVLRHAFRGARRTPPAGPSGA